MAASRAPASGRRLCLAPPKGPELLAFLPTAVWGYLVLARGRYWSVKTGLPPAMSVPETWPAVTVIVPARNEAELIPRTLPSLLTQDYPGELRVVLVDDMSTDGTAEVAGAIGYSDHEWETSMS